MITDEIAASQAFFRETLQACCENNTPPVER
jgi:hypothetical protein